MSDKYRIRDEYRTQGEEKKPIFIKGRCPKCGSRLIIGDYLIWCTFIGSQGEYPFLPACDFMLDVHPLLGTKGE